MDDGKGLGYGSFKKNQGTTGNSDSIEQESEKENLIKLLTNTKRDMFEKELYALMENLQNQHLL
jgi:hypothetical protein